jgi:hypothetical protein
VGLRGSVKRVEKDCIMIRASHRLLLECFVCFIFNRVFRYATLNNTTAHTNCLLCLPNISCSKVNVFRYKPEVALGVPGG